MSAPASPAGRALLLLLAAVIGTLAGGCITRATDQGIAFPRAVHQLRGLGVDAAIGDHELAQMLEVYCARPPGTTNLELEPLLLRQLDVMGMGPDEVGIALIEALGTLPIEYCTPAHGDPDGFSRVDDPRFWSDSLAENRRIRADLRQAMPDDLGRFTGLHPTADYSESGILAMDFTLDDEVDVDVLARLACQSVLGLAALIAYSNLAPRHVALISGHHDPILRLTLTSPAASYTLDSRPDGLTATVTRCNAGQ